MPVNRMLDGKWFLIGVGKTVFSIGLGAADIMRQPLEGASDQGRTFFPL